MCVRDANGCMGYVLIRHRIYVWCMCVPVLVTRVQHEVIKVCI